jgi:hypothetical protein
MVELGIRCDVEPPDLFKYHKPESPGYSLYTLLPTAEVAKAGMPCLTLRTEFVFRDDVFCHFLHHKRLRSPADIKHQLIVLVRDPRDTLWSLYNLLDFPDKEIRTFAWFAKEAMSRWIPLYSDCLLLENHRVFRFEDAKHDPEKTLRSVVDFCEIECSDDLIRKAAAASTTEKAREGEQRFFAVTPPEKRHFKQTLNRSGKTQQWRDIPEHAAVFRYVEQQATPLMELFGYL